MSKAKLYNSLTNAEEELAPLDGERVRVYHCGPTVYKRPHIGNLRRFLFADFLRRSLELLGYDVLEVTNITDVGHLTQDEIDEGEDKMEREAKEQKVTPQDIAERVTGEYFADIAALNIRKSHEHPKATDHIKEMQEIIQKLLDSEHAYIAESGVYFDVTTFSEYGKLSGNTFDRLNAGERVDVREEKKNPFDFALWVLNDPDHLQQWDSPWGKGYPGWHIECSAMSRKYLGETFDIHTGGEDNKFPHHENEIAQTEAHTGKPMAQIWMHNAHLQLGGEKLAKSGDKQITLTDIQERGFSPLAFRLLVLGTHYRKPLQFSWGALEAAQGQLNGIRNFLRRVGRMADVSEKNADSPVLNDFSNAVADDLNTPKALGVFMEYMRELNSKLDRNEDISDDFEVLAAMDHVLGVLAPLFENLQNEVVPTDVAELARKRDEARAHKDFARSDELRDEIEARGYHVRDEAGETIVAPSETV